MGAVEVMVRLKRVQQAAKHMRSKNLFLLFWSEFKCSSKTVSRYNGPGGGGTYMEEVTRLSKHSSCQRPLHKRGWPVCAMHITFSCMKDEINGSDGFVSVLPLRFLFAIGTLHFCHQLIWSHSCCGCAFAQLPAGLFPLLAPNRSLPLLPSFPSFPPLVSVFP